LYTANGNVKGARELADIALAEGKNNIAFAALFQLNQMEECITLLLKTERIPEAAMFARTYLPSHVSPVVKLWKEDLERRNRQKNAESLADPKDYENLFPDFRYALIGEESFLEARATSIPATSYPELKGHLCRDILAEVKAQFPNGLPSDTVPNGEATTVNGTVELEEDDLEVVGVEEVETVTESVSELKLEA